MVELPKLTSGEVIAGAAVALGSAALVGGALLAHKRRRKRKSKKRHHAHTHNKRKKSNRHRKLKFGSRAYRKKYLKHGHRRTPHTAGKRKDTSHRRIRYTRRGQPYIIGSNGRTRFISRKSAKSSYKRKGGRY